ncbi:MAG: hypothetical protein JWN27_2119 [Candidatus Eremiobacteraeota bacterium]|nr:hypothetical protein [Candidatus Eremiobacteraeota bacterium]
MRAPLIAVAIVACAALCADPRGAAAEWQPAGLRPAATTLAEVLATNAKAAGTPQAAFADRRERWTYTNGSRVLPVDVAVKGDDFRATVAVGSALYDAGRLHGVRWRGDANGIVHGLFADQQGDALDRLPQSLFPFDPKRCELAGETVGPNPAWVIVDRPSGEPPSWFFVDEASGLIVREETREGQRVFGTTFDRFAPVAGVERPRHWHISDGDPHNDLDVAVETIAPGPVPAAAVSLPLEQHVFAPAAGPLGIVELPAEFRQGRVSVAVVVGGRREHFILDSGTASITLDAGDARRFDPLLEHAIVPRMSVGSLEMGDVSVLAIPTGVGILGYDFFFGHVVRIDYLHERVEVLSHEAAASVFADPNTVVLPANVDYGLPLVHVTLGRLASGAFAVDTGSPDLFAFGPFARRNAAEIAAHWSAAGRNHVVNYLEGSVYISPRRVSEFDLGPFRFKNADVGVEIPNTMADALAIPFDGIIGTNVLRSFDLYFDYDHGRIGLRR